MYLSVEKAQLRVREHKQMELRGILMQQKRLLGIFYDKINGGYYGTASGGGTSKGIEFSWGGSRLPLATSLQSPQQDS